MSKVKKETLKVLSDFIDEKITKKAADRTIKATPKSVSGKIITLLGDMKEDLALDKFDADQVIKAYKNNKLTNTEVAEKVVEALVVKATDTFIASFDFSKVLNHSEAIITQGLFNATLSSLAEDLLFEKSINFSAQDVYDILYKAFDEICDSKTRIVTRDITVNELIYGDRIAKGIGYDHLLEFTVPEMIKHMSATKRFEFIGLQPIDFPLAS